MPKTPKRKSKAEEMPTDVRSSWSEDQKKREYYYDDAHGYETFDPDADESEDETEGDNED
jgi:hypothetical protein